VDVDTCKPGHAGDGREEEQIDNHPVQASSGGSIANSRDMTSCFLRLANLDNGALERLGRYETALWRQIVQTLLVLRTAGPSGGQQPCDPWICFRVRIGTAQDIYIYIETAPTIGSYSTRQPRSSCAKMRKLTAAP
jgi:hypothetical protein